MSVFNHTGNLEVYYSVLLKYCEKSSHSSYEGMIARTELTAFSKSSDVINRGFGCTILQHCGEIRVDTSDVSNMADTPGHNIGIYSPWAS